MYMFNNSIHRIGFACKYWHPDRSLTKKLLEEIERPLNERTTTITWLNRQTREVAEQRLWDFFTAQQIHFLFLWIFSVTRVYFVI